MIELFTAPTTVGAFLFASGLAAAMAAWGIVTQRMIARKRATLDVILRGQTDKDLIDARLVFVRRSKEPGGLAPWAEKEREGEADVQKIVLVLNEFEIIAIGVRAGIIDYALYERWAATTTIQFWRAGEPFITRLRQRIGTEALYKDFDDLVVRLELALARAKRSRANPRRSGSKN